MNIEIQMHKALEGMPEAINDRASKIMYLIDACGATWKQADSFLRFYDDNASSNVSKTRDLNYELDWIGGNCPVQAEGKIDGHLFYFRARGDVLQMSVSETDPLGDDAWFFEQTYRMYPDAGYISQRVALFWIEFALAEWQACMEEKNNEQSS